MKNNEYTRYYLIPHEVSSHFRNSKAYIEDFENTAPCMTLVSAQRYQQRYPGEFDIYKIDFNITKIKG